MTNRSTKKGAWKYFFILGCSTCYQKVAWSSRALASFHCRPPQLTETFNWNLQRFVNLSQQWAHSWVMDLESLEVKEFLMTFLKVLCSCWRWLHFPYCVAFCCQVDFLSNVIMLLYVMIAQNCRIDSVNKTSLWLWWGQYVCVSGYNATLLTIICHMLSASPCFGM